MSDARSREEESVRWDPLYRSNAEVAVQQHRRDRKANPEGVDATCALEEEGRVRGDDRATAQPLHPCTPGLGDERSKDQTARTHHGYLSHRGTVAPAGDITAPPKQEPGGIFSFDPNGNRVEGVMRA
jgi:hypothetical protein